MSIKKDINGKESAKRAWASRMLWSAIIILWIYFVIWIYSEIKEKQSPNMPDSLLDMWFGIAIAGLTALGFTLGETFKNKFRSSAPDTGSHPDPDKEEK